LFRSEKLFRTTRELEYFFLVQNVTLGYIFFQNLTLGYMTKTLNQIISFFLHQNQNIFFSNIGNQNIFLKKKHNPPPPPPGSYMIRPLSQGLCDILMETR
jgi:hypothetical protein